MTAIVVDASVTLRAAFAGETGHAEVEARFAELTERGVEAVAPDILVYEIGQAIRRTGGPAADRGALMLVAMQLARIERPSLDALLRAQTLPSRLSYYDAAYIALAEDLGALLWTEDRAILKAVPTIAADTASLPDRLRT